MTASSSQLSQSLQLTSMNSSASERRSSASGAHGLPKLWASASVPELVAFQAARPLLTKSSVASALETLKGSLYVVGTLTASPMYVVSGARRASTESASRHPVAAVSDS